MAEILRGAPVVEYLSEKIKNQVEYLKTNDVSPTLVILRVGEKPDDISYERNAIKRCESVGVNVKSIVLSDDIPQSSLLKCIEDLNNDNSVHGVLILRPLPKHLNERDICETLSPSKDIDGITMQSLAKVFIGSSEDYLPCKGFEPCTAQAVLEILDFYNIDCRGKNVVIVGRSLVVGKPVAMMLLSRNATVTVCHTRTIDLPNITRNADIVVVATGQPEGLTKEYFSGGQVVIDVGINWDEKKGKLCGDVKFDEVSPVVAAITPVPGGVGTVTTSVMVLNVVLATNRQNNL